jgi:hypothetical protein
MQRHERIGRQALPDDKANNQHDAEANEGHDIVGRPSMRCSSRQPVVLVSIGEKNGGAIQNIRYSTEKKCET